MSAGGGGFFNQFTPLGEGGGVPPGVTKAVARAGVSITLDPKEEEVSPLRMQRSMNSPTTTGIYTGKVNTPYVVLSAIYFPSGWHPSHEQ